MLPQRIANMFDANLLSKPILKTLVARAAHCPGQRSPSHAMQVRCKDLPTGAWVNLHVTQISIVHVQILRRVVYLANVFIKFARTRTLCI